MEPLTPGSPVLLFDGICGLCDSLVQWVIRRDPRGVIHFASLQSERGRALARDAGIPGGEIEALHTVYFLAHGRAYGRSEAIRHLLLFLPAPWRWLGFMFVLPVEANDFCYSWVAHRRYRVFGKRDSCRIPSARERERFLE